MKLALLFLLVLCIPDACEKNNDTLKESEIIDPIVASIKRVPVLAGNSENELITIAVPVLKKPSKPLAVTMITLQFADNGAPGNLSTVKVLFNGTDQEQLIRESFGTVVKPGITAEIKGKCELSAGNNIFKVSLVAAEKINYLATLKIEGIKLTFSDGSIASAGFTGRENYIRFGMVLRAAGQDACDTYRIPGLVTTNRGTLIAVYDNRYLNSTDLQGDIDIGMSRSNDGGNSWEPMKVIMNMEKWGGKPEEENGIGDPCVLVDKATGAIWVAGLWISGFPGQRAWNASGPGIEPTVTGQFILVKSEDDGITWSKPINITPQIKKPEWRLLLQGPGNGISLENGTLIFPAQYRDTDGLPYSTIAWSSDHGQTWHIGTGAKGNTTEAQCVELTSGNIMLNMRDNLNATVKDQNNGRAVAVTNDLGKTWTTHPSSNSALPEPVCMASLISADIKTGGITKRVLFFSNPANKTSRSNMTIKASIDEGLTWPQEYHLEINADQGYGYSCLTMIDQETIGILYEGTKNLIFQKIPVADIIKVK
jgi:sialidase-1